MGLAFLGYSACENFTCEGNVTQFDPQGDITEIKVHKGAGNDFCTVAEDAGKLQNCRVGTLYPDCK